MVSILVILDVALELRPPSWYPFLVLPVSILVILDVALEQEADAAWSAVKGFNPCYPGCCP